MPNLKILMRITMNLWTKINKKKLKQTQNIKLMNQFLQIFKRYFKMNLKIKIYYLKDYKKNYMK